MSKRPDISPSLPTLTSPKADRVKRVKALSGRLARKKTFQALVEGPGAVRELIKYQPELVQDLYFTPDSSAKYPDIWQAAVDEDIFVHVGTSEVLEAMSPNAQEILAVIKTGGIVKGEAALEQLPEKIFQVAVLVEVKDPGNLGTVIRAADAAGADAVLLVGDCVEIFNPKVIRSTVGSLFHLPVIDNLRWDQVADYLASQDVSVVATDGHSETTILQVPELLEKPLAWVFGTEAHGLPANILQDADARVSIPMPGKAESLNLAMASTLCLFLKVLGVR